MNEVIFFFALLNLFLSGFAAGITLIAWNQGDHEYDWKFACLAVFFMILAIAGIWWLQ